MARIVRLIQPARRARRGYDRRRGRI